MAKLTTRRLFEYPGRTWINRDRQDHRVNLVRETFHSLTSSLALDRVFYLDLSAEVPRVIPAEQLIDDPIELDRFLFCDEQEIGDPATRFLVALRPFKSLRDLVVFAEGLDPNTKFYLEKDRLALVMDVAEMAWARDHDGGCLECIQYE